jgi:Taurine catabolism dioxygenase TauD, TfdA family
VYETNLYLPYHADPSDVVGLLCIRKAREGGLSSLVSVAAIYNEILAAYPEYLGLFYRPMYFAHLCEPMPSLSPIFSFHAGKLSCRYLRQYLV